MNAEVRSLVERTDRVYGAPACTRTGHLEAEPGDGTCMYCGQDVEVQR